jgi:SAM-dependent methyltransferase
MNITIKKILHKLRSAFPSNGEKSLLMHPKYRAEISFWKHVLQQYVLWYKGDVKVLYEEPSPVTRQQGYDEASSAIQTWIEVHQKAKYLQDLQLTDQVFSGEKILDIGSGPLPSALAFKDCEVYCLDPLYPLYLEAGYPLHIYESRAKFACGFSEKMPFETGFFDSIISVNALDHVDDFFATAQEIKRVLKPNGKLRFHLHYHSKTPTEPLELNDAVVSEAFSWAENFKKILQTKEKRGTRLTGDDESFTVWSNF